MAKGLGRIQIVTECGEACKLLHLKQIEFPVGTDLRLAMDKVLSTRATEYKRSTAAKQPTEGSALRQPLRIVLRDL
jgi:hypothetical protein